MIPYGRQNISDGDIQTVIEVLRSDFLTQGPQVPAFEKALADYCGVSHGVAVNSATSALHIACLALGLSPGDRLWTSPITFVASANCGLFCGATVDFVDIDPHSYNMCPKALEAKLIKAQHENTLPKVVIPVHHTGQACDMQAIAALAKKYGFRIIEDASHAVGGRYRNHAIGSCEFSDITVFSFHPVKIITSAEGGMALTNDQTLAHRMVELRSHGITRDRTRLTRDEGPWYYEQHNLGFNFRMTEIQAALGHSQLSRLNSFIERRHLIAHRYDSLLADMPLDTPSRLPYNVSAFHLYVILLHDASKRRKVFEGLQAKGICVNVHYIPVHRQPYYEHMGFHAGQFPAAENYYRRAISLPMYPDLADEQQDRVVSELKTVLDL